MDNSKTNMVDINYYKDLQKRYGLQNMTLAELKFLIKTGVAVPIYYGSNPSSTRQNLATLLPFTDNAVSLRMTNRLFSGTWPHERALANSKLVQTINRHERHEHHINFGKTDMTALMQHPTIKVVSKVAALPYTVIPDTFSRMLDKKLKSISDLDAATLQSISANILRRLYNLRPTLFDNITIAALENMRLTATQFAYMVCARLRKGKSSFTISKEVLDWIEVQSFTDVMSGDTPRSRSTDRSVQYLKTKAIING